MSHERALIGPPLWLSAETLHAIIEEASGELARNHFRRLNLMGGYAPSPQFREIAEYMREQADAIGLEGVRLEEFPSDGERFYWAFLTEPSWDAKGGSLWQVTPHEKRLADFAMTPGALARFSHTTEAEAELVYVGVGRTAEDYEGKDVEGKVVLATGPMGAAHAAAVYERGALGVVTFRARGYDLPDLVPSGQLTPWRGPDGKPSTFGFSISYRQGQELLSELKRGEVRVRVKIDADVGPGEYLEVTGAILGSERPEEEVLLTAHIDHRNTGGNNATGDGVSLEVARTLARLIGEGVLPRPRRTIRFIWGAEHKGFLVYLHHHPEALDRWLFVLNYDMAGKDQSTGVRVHMKRSPSSNPTVVDDALQEILEWAIVGNKVHRALQMSAPPQFPWPILDSLGSRDDFLADVNPYFWGLSDHEELNDGNLGIHSAQIGDWPDPYIGAHQDNPETADPTQMKRIAVIGAAFLHAMANAGPREAEELIAVGAARARERLAAQLRKAVARISDAGAAELPRVALEARISIEANVNRELRSLEAIEPWLEDESKAAAFTESMISQLAGDGDRLIEELGAFHLSRAEALGVPPVLAERSPEEESLRGRVPVRAETPRGPVGPNRFLYGGAWLEERLGGRELLDLAILRDGEYVAYEALNFVDGKRDLLQIRDSVSAEFTPVPAGHIEEFFSVLEKAGVVSFV
ncbi:MAG: M28 family peptidase [Candidatus Bathyarchaeota archaeon]|nr:M28 family peptidase [Candidatus Bathyarchaeota archaeon]